MEHCTFISEATPATLVIRPFIFFLQLSACVLWNLGDDSFVNDCLGCVLHQRLEALIQLRLMLRRKHAAELKRQIRRQELRQAMKQVVAEGGVSQLSSRQLSTAVSASQSAVEHERELRHRMVYVLLAEHTSSSPPACAGSVTVFRKRIRGQPHVYVANLAIVPEFRRRGIAHRLMDKAERIARLWKAHSIYLNVDISNHRARRLYNKCVQQNHLLACSCVFLH